MFAVAFVGEVFLYSDSIADLVRLSLASICNIIATMSYQQEGLSPAPPRRRPSQPTIPAHPVATSDSGMLHQIMVQLQQLSRSQESMKQDFTQRFDIIDQSHQTLLSGQKRLHDRVSGVEQQVAALAQSVDEVKSDVDNLLQGHSTVSSQVAQMNFAFEEETARALRAGDGEEGRLVPMVRVKTAIAGLMDFVVSHTQMFVQLEGTMRKRWVKEMKQEVLVDLRDEMEREYQARAQRDDYAR